MKVIDKLLPHVAVSALTAGFIFSALEETRWMWASIIVMIIAYVIIALRWNDVMKEE